LLADTCVVAKKPIRASVRFAFVHLVYSTFKGEFNPVIELFAMQQYSIPYPIKLDEDDAGKGNSRNSYNN
jgi:hypothetical protein